jgi:YfiR/HmsC-like
MLNISAFFSRLMLVLLLVGAITDQARAKSGSEAAVKTAYLFNFFKFIDWPEAAASQSAYSLCTTDNDQLGDSLLVLENKTIGNKPIVIHRGINGKDLKNCHMVFIGADEDTSRSISNLHGLAVVTVSDKPDFINEGGIIGFIHDDNHLVFEVNLDIAKAVDIRISGQLLKLAKRVNVAK